MKTPSPLIIGVTPDGDWVSLLPSMANRHGLIAGATGTGKTVTLQVLTEHFSRIGVPVFTADVKGDLSGLAGAGSPTPKLMHRLESLKINPPEFRANPVLFWDVFGEQGHPVRTTLSEMGPLLLGRVLNLNETQEQVLQLAFQIADTEGLLLLDLKDLKELLAWISDNAAELKDEYGNIAAVTLGTIQRNLMNLSQAGGDRFFGEPALKIEHLMQRDFSGQGVISILDATKLLHDSRLYATFLLWLLSELYEDLEEVGDQSQPRMVFFFDEAHLLFKDAPTALVDKIEQVVRLIRSKGVGIYFVTQNPLDIPERILAQLGNRIQHALRAYTPSEQKAVRAAAQSFRENPDFDTEAIITELGVGEALVSVLAADGTPTPVQRAKIIAPGSCIGPVTEAVRKERISQSPLAGVYTETLDRESAFEILKARQKEAAKQASSREGNTKSAEEKPTFLESLFKSTGRRQSAAEALLKSVLRTVGSTLGREITRGVLGSLGGSTRRRR